MRKVVVPGAEITQKHLKGTKNAHLVDVWEAANRDDLFPVTSLKHYPYIANSDFHRRRHLYSWKTLVRACKDWPSIQAALRANVGVAITLYRNGSWQAEPLPVATR